MTRSIITAALAAAALLAPAVHAADYPTKTVRMVIAFSPGGPSDILSRLVGGKLSERMGQPFVFDNRPGAGGNVAGEIVATSPADGYTLMIANNSVLAANASLYKKMTFNPAKDLVPVVWVASQPNILVVHPSVPAKSVQELVSYLKSQPGKLNYASSGSGAAAHLAGELFKSMTKTDMVHIPFKGAAPAITDVLAGRSQMIFATALSVKAHLDANRLRPLGVTTLKRMDTMPNLPTIAESGVPGFEASTWHGLVAVAGTPRPVLVKLNAEVNAVLKDPQVSKFLESQGAIIEGGTAEKFAAYIKSEIPKWAKVIKDSGARAD
ncbi:MAG: tripartite tricarboxylate transporter substrate binding protein [Burkholderiales bacterium]|jgi:tripartite-type tricarboxylate transporter receptor subunit TctC|nr:tripartite tricarboxylate transporter substrate binding protein [Burkholderiales bacterium]